MGSLTNPDPVGAGAAGTPVLYGPYVVDFSDIPHDGDKITLWTPALGDVLLRLFPDWQTVVQWDHGTLLVGQGVDSVGGSYHNACAVGGTGLIGRDAANNLDSLNLATGGIADDATGSTYSATATVFGTTDPVQIMLTDTVGTDPTQGHVALYALVARATAP